MKRFISLTVLIIMALTTSCAPVGTVNNNVTIVPPVEVTDEITEALTQPPLVLPNLDLKGAEFKLLVPESVGWVRSRDFDFDESLAGEPINDAVQERNVKVEEELNVKIIAVHSAAVTGDARKEIMSGGKTFSVIMPALTEVKTLAAEGILIDLNKVETLKLDSPWWSQNSNANLSIKNKLYFTLGDISLIDNDGIGPIGFNKKLLAENQIDSPYEYVRSDTWTLDVLYGMCKGMNRDLNGDGVLDANDQYGLTYDPEDLQMLLYASGEKLVSKSKDDIPYPSIYNERANKVIDLFIAFANDKTAAGRTAIFGDHGKANIGFANDQILFRFTSMYRLTQMREMVSDFGILPMPKFEESQVGYYSAYSYASPGVALPVTLESPAETGAVLEALAYYGRYIVLPAYYEITLQSKVARDDDSSDMLDIIFSGATFDLGMVYNFGGLRDIFNKFVNENSNTFSSTYESILPKVLSAIEDVTKIYDELS